jgi:hypothetical protein
VNCDGAGQPHKSEQGSSHSFLCAPALAIIEVVRKEHDSTFLFQGGKRDMPLSNMAMLALLDRMGCSDLTAHGFRSTLLRLGCRADQSSARSCRDGSRACDWQQGRGRLPVRYLFEKRPFVDGGLGEVLHRNQARFRAGPPHQPVWIA